MERPHFARFTHKDGRLVVINTNHVLTVAQAMTKDLVPVVGIVGIEFINAQTLLVRGNVGEIQATLNSNAPDPNPRQDDHPEFHSPPNF